jgi:hypothetical protein
MIRLLVLATSMLVLLAMSSDGFAYSNVSPKEAPQQTMPVRQSQQSPFVFRRTMPSWTIKSDNQRYTAALPYRSALGMSAR